MRLEIEIEPHDFPLEDMFCHVYRAVIRDTTDCADPGDSLEGAFVKEVLSGTLSNTLDLVKSSILEMDEIRNPKSKNSHQPDK